MMRFRQNINWSAALLVLAGFIPAPAQEAALPREDVLGVIRRWQTDIFVEPPQRTLAYQAAMILDPVSKMVADSLAPLLKDADTPQTLEAAFNGWSAEHVTHTQMQPEYAGLPGHDPWGVSDAMPCATFKKLLPAEMLAMKTQTGKISGKCLTLINFWGAVFVHLGVDPDDMVFLHMQLGPARHGVMLMKLKGHLMLFDNYALHPYSWPESQGDRAFPIVAVYNFRDFREVRFGITRDDFDAQSFSGDTPLMQQFLACFDLNPCFPDFGNRQPLDVGHPQNLQTQVYSPGAEGIALFCRYALQRLDVPHPEYYLEASAQQSLPKELALKLGSAEAVLEWIAANTKAGPIFSADEKRIMTADEVLVFGQGSSRDKALLAVVMLHHLGMKSRCLFTETSAYVEAPLGLFDMATGEKANHPQGDIKTALTLNEAYPGLNARRLEANVAVTNRKMDEALVMFKENAALYPDSWAAQAELAEMLMAQHEAEPALKAYETLLRLDPSDARQIYRASLAALMAGQADKAVDFINQAVALEPGYVPMALNRVLVLALSDRQEAAHKAYEPLKNINLAKSTARAYLTEEFIRLKKMETVDDAAVERVNKLLEE